MLGESSRALLLIGIGFLLMAGGLPISSPAMFGFLMNLAHDEGWPWLFAGLFVGFFTVAGHAISYAAFRQFRPFIWNRVIRRYPSIHPVFTQYLPSICPTFTEHLPNTYRTSAGPLPNIQEPSTSYTPTIYLFNPG
jgi:hypothetical protein